MKASQPPLPTMPPNYRQPIDCKCRDLAALIIAGKQAGFDGVRLTVIRGGYRVSFQRQPTAPPAPAKGIFFQTAKIRGSGVNPTRTLQKPFLKSPTHDENFQ